MKKQILQLYAKSKGLSLKDIGMEATGRIYMNESLTKSNLEIFRYAMTFKRSKDLAAVTTFNGLVHVRQHQTDRYARIFSKQELNVLLDLDNNDIEISEANATSRSLPASFLAHADSPTEELIINPTIAKETAVPANTITSVPSSSNITPTTTQIVKTRSAAIKEPIKNPFRGNNSSSTPNQETLARKKIQEKRPLRNNTNRQ